MTSRRRPLVVACAVALVALTLAACGDDGDEQSAPAAAPTTTSAGTTPATDAPPTGSSPVGGTGAAPCERVTATELSTAFGATFDEGAEVADGRCVFDSDGAPQFSLTVYPGASGVCELMARELEAVEIAGSPGFWDEAGAQARVCLPDESVAAILNGGGGDNSVHRQALLDVVALAAGR